MTQVLDGDMPADLRRFIEESRSIPLPRTPFFVPENDPPAQIHAVSPKKLHEVFTMSSYIASLFANHLVKPAVVDIGAGQVRIFSHTGALDVLFLPWTQL
jgi:hypothetical protein